MKLNRTISIAGGTAGLCLLLFAFKGDNHNFQLTKNLSIFNTIVREADMFYVDTLNPQKSIEDGIRGMLSQLDPYTQYYPEDNDSELKMMTTGKYAGVGSIIRYNPKKERVMLIEPYEGQPAQKAGLLAGDLLLSVDGKDTHKLPVDKVSDMLRGEAGTTVEVVVERPTLTGADTLTRRIERESIQLPPVPYYGMANDSTGYILFESFTDKCSKEIRHAVIELKEQGATALVIDLRDNGGGLLSEAVEIASLFIPKGSTVIETRGKIRQATRTYKTEKEPLDTQIPVVILTNSQTASSSEIVAGALQDMDRAVIMGSRTYGKGLVQNVRDLPYNGSLKITTAKYYIPSGRCIQAINYAQRNADGSVARIPDSLTTVFKTAAGRQVRDGGGIQPDVEEKGQRIPNIVYYMSNDDIFFNYATQYRNRHPSIAPAGEFAIDDEEYARFKEWVKEQNFTYDRESLKALKALKELAEFEGYLKESEAEFEALQQKLSHNLEQEMDNFAPTIKEFLSDEIVTRYHYQRGAVQNHMRSDSTLSAALQLLAHRDRYHALLQPQAESGPAVASRK